VTGLSGGKEQYLGVSAEISQISNTPGLGGVVNIFFLVCWNCENRVLIFPIPSRYLGRGNSQLGIFVILKKVGIQWLND